MGSWCNIWNAGKLLPKLVPFNGLHYLQAIKNRMHRFAVTQAGVLPIEEHGQVYLSCYWIHQVNALTLWTVNQETTVRIFSNLIASKYDEVVVYHSRCYFVVPCGKFIQERCDISQDSECCLCLPSIPFCVEIDSLGIKQISFSTR